MNPKSFFQKDPDYFEGSFESILFEAEKPSRKGSIILGLIKEHGTLYFVLRQRYPGWTKDASLDRIRLSEAIRRFCDQGGLSGPGSRIELLRFAFEHFVKESPFGHYIRSSVNAWATGQFFKELREISPSILTEQSRQQDEQGKGQGALQRSGSDPG